MSEINYTLGMQSWLILQGRQLVARYMYPIIRNYRLDLSLARSTISPRLKHDTTRLQLIAPLIKQAVEWGSELKAKAKVTDLDLLLPPFWKEMLSREYPFDKVRALCFSHLYGTVTNYSNAILRLIEDSFGSVSFGLLRSVMEAYSKCLYISQSMESRQTICHDYIAISHIAEMYDAWDREAKLRHRHNMPSVEEASEERFESSPSGEEVEVFRLTPALMKMLKDRFVTFPHHLAWVNPKSNKTTSIASIIEDADKKYAKLYHLCNPELHGNYTGMPRYGAIRAVTPLRLIPFTAWGKSTFFEDFKELEFDFLVTEILVRSIELAPSFLLPDDSYTQTAITLADNGNSVLAKLKGS